MDSGWWDKLKSTFNTVKGHVEDAGRFITDNIDEDTTKAILKGAVTVGTKLAKREDHADKINSGVDKGVSYGYDTKKKSLKEHAKDLSQVYTPKIDEGVDFVKQKAEKKFNEKFGKKEEDETQGEGFKKSKKREPGNERTDGEVKGNAC